MRTVWLILTLGVAAVGAAFYAGQRVEAAKQYDREVRVVVESLAVLDTVYLTDTLRLTRWREKWDTVRQTVEVWKHDTARVVEYVLVADSTIRACTAALRTCEQRAALEGQRADLAEAKLKDLAATQDKKERRNLLLGAALGVVGGVVLKR